MIEFYINELLSEGITYIPPWTDPNEKTRNRRNSSKKYNPSTLGTSRADGEDSLDGADETSLTLSGVCSKGAGTQAEVGVSESTVVVGPPPSPSSSRPRTDSASSRSSLMLGASAANIAHEGEGGSPASKHLFQIRICFIFENSTLVF